jgi:hypothetical protein
MKFIRRHDLDPQTCIEIVKLVWQGQGIYGKMTQMLRILTFPEPFCISSLGPLSVNWKHSLAS